MAVDYDILDQRWTLTEGGGGGGGQDAVKPAGEYHTILTSYVHERKSWETAGERKKRVV